jgi:hypothetical protein
MSKERSAQLVDAGVWLRLSGDLEGARKLFERALKLDPANERATQLLNEGPLRPVPAADELVTAPFEAAHSVAPAVAPVTASDSSPAILPTTSSSVIERPPSPEDLDWGKATGFESPTPFRTPLPDPFKDEWGAKLEVPDAPSNTPRVSQSSTISLGNPDTDFPVRSTPPIFGSSSSQRAPPLSVTLDGSGAPPPTSNHQMSQAFNDPSPAAPRSPGPADWRSPGAMGPSAPSSRTVTLTDENAPSPSPPRSTPPLFDAGTQQPPTPSFPSFSQSPIPMVAPPNVDVPLTAAPDPVGVAWAWSNSSPTPFRDPAAKEPPAPAPVLPSPMPSPLTPNATSAWDNQSNPGIKLSAAVGEARALEMISSDSAVRHQSNPETARDEVKILLRGARDLLDLDDHTGAMELITKAQIVAPDDPEVKALRVRSEKTLLTMFESKLGKLETIPRVLLKEDEIIWLNLDHRAGFVLAQIDGTVSFDDLFAVSGMSRLDTSRILSQLIDEGVISRS